MKTISNIILSALCLTTLVFSGCNKDTVNPEKNINPDLSVSGVSDVTSNSAIIYGNCDDAGGNEIISRGFCWSTNFNPGLTDDNTTCGSGNGSFQASITGLEPQKTYYVKSYAKTSKGTYYSDSYVFTTSQLHKIKVRVTNLNIYQGDEPSVSQYSDGTGYKKVCLNSSVYFEVDQSSSPCLYIWTCEGPCNWKKHAVPLNTGGTYIYTLLSCNRSIMIVRESGK